MALLSVAVINAKPQEARPARSGSHVLLPPEDYIEIQQLYGMYARDVDPGSARDASWMFTPEGTFGKQSGQGMKDFYANVRTTQSAGIRHFNTSYAIVGTPDGGARGSSYMMEVERRKEGGPIEVTLFGKYEDRLVKTKDGWRFTDRQFYPDTWRDSKAPVRPSPIPGDN